MAQDYVLEARKNMALKCKVCGVSSNSAMCVKCILISHHQSVSAPHVGAINNASRCAGCGSGFVAYGHCLICGTPHTLTQPPLPPKVCRFCNSPVGQLTGLCFNSNCRINAGIYATHLGAVKPKVKKQKGGKVGIYCHYERVTLQMTDQTHPVASQRSVVQTFNLLRYRLSSGAAQTTVNFKRDKEQLERINTLVKQIPAGRRSFDPVDLIWTVPEATFKLIETLVGPANMIDHTAGVINLGCGLAAAGLYAFIHPPPPPLNFDPNDISWEEAKKRVIEAGVAQDAEEFFKNKATASTAMPLEIIRTRLVEFLKPFVTFELLVKDAKGIVDEKATKDNLLRGFKLAQRKLHPDLGGDPKKASDLGQLMMEYKEVVQ